jgi:hypothetical protein
VARPTVKLAEEQTMKKTKRYEDGGYLLDSEGKRVKSGSGDDVRSGSYDKEAEMESARKNLAQDVQNKLKADKAAKDDADFAEADRMSSTARSVAGKPASKAATSAKAKSGVVTKEELAKSGLTLREYMNKQQGKTARGSAPAKAQSKASTPAVSSSYRSEGANKAKPAASSGNVSSAAPAAKPKALAISSGVLKQREADEKRREERREIGRQRDAKKKEESAAKDQMSPGQRSAARGKAVKEFFGMAKGGSVRGSGIAQRGVRKCKMV